MDWGEFWTWIAQGLIVVAVLFVISAVGMAIYEGIREKDQ